MYCSWAILIHFLLFIKCCIFCVRGVDDQFSFLCHFKFDILHITHFLFFQHSVSSKAKIDSYLFTSKISKIKVRNVTHNRSVPIQEQCIASFLLLCCKLPGLLLKMAHNSSSPHLFKSIFLIDFLSWRIIKGRIWNVPYCSCLEHLFPSWWHYVGRLRKS